MLPDLYVHSLISFIYIYVRCYLFIDCDIELLKRLGRLCEGQSEVPLVQLKLP